MSEQRYWILMAKKLAGELSADEQSEWERLQREFAHLRYSEESLGHAWAASQEGPSPAAEAALERHMQRLADAGISIDGPAAAAAPRKRRLAAFALPATVLLLGGWLFWKRTDAFPAQPAPRLQSEVSTRPGSRTRVLLPDSTVVWLNSGSRLTYADGFGSTHRRTTLTGEAYFDVTHNAALPFEIQTSDVRIRVLGTAFNVKAYPGEATETSLLRGQVQLTLEKRPGETYRLRPNEKLTVGAPADSAAGRPLVVLGSLVPTAGKEVVETAWMENKLVFRNEPIGVLAARMSRWYGVPVTVADHSLSEERVSGAFANETLAQALTELQLIAHFRLERQDSGYVLTAAKKSG